VEEPPPHAARGIAMSAAAAAVRVIVFSMGLHVRAVPN
jgi:hypothetical protein